MFKLIVFYQITKSKPLDKFEQNVHIPDLVPNVVTLQMLDLTWFQS